MYCNSCQVESSNTLFCHICDLYLPATERGVRASLGQRLLAFLLDGFVSVGLGAAFLALLRQTVNHSSTASGFYLMTASIALLFCAAFFLWSFSRGQTPGKWLAQARVVDKRNGRVPGIGRMLLRETIGKWVSLLFFGLGYFWAIWDKDGQAWHDKIAGTVVLNQRNASDKAEPASAAWYVVGALGLAGVVFALLPSSQFGHNETRDTRNANIAEAPLSKVTASQALAIKPSAARSMDEPSGDQLQPLAAISSPETEQEVVSTISASLSEFLDQVSADRNVASADRIAKHYTPNVDRYFLARNVSRSWIRQNVAEGLSREVNPSDFHMTLLQSEELSPTTVLIRAQKTYTLSGEVHSNVSRLWLVKDGNSYLITGEQDLRS